MSKKMTFLFTTLLCTSVFTMADEKSMQNQLDELEERVDSNELAATLDKIKFSLDFHSSLNNFFIKNDNTSHSQTNKWMMGLYLNMNASVNDYTKFTGRLSMSKAFGDVEWGFPATIGSLDAGRTVGGGVNLYVERAYIDIFGGNSFAFSIGRLPGTDGPGSNLRNNSARMSTYPALVVNTLGDGAVFTYKPYNEAALRAGYVKVYQPLITEDTGGNIFGLSENSIADSNLYFAAFETPFVPNSFGKSLLMLTYVHITDYTIPSRVLSQINLGNQSKNAGNLQYTNVHIENDHLLGTGFNWFMAGTYYKGSEAKELVPHVPSSILFANENSWAVHLGIRYDFNPHFKLGYEYFHGGEYWYALSSTSVNDPFNFRNTRGDVHDVYAILQIDINQFFRLSYTQQKHQYAPPALPMKTNKVDLLTRNIALAYLLRF